MKTNHSMCIANWSSYCKMWLLRE